MKLGRITFSPATRFVHLPITVKPSAAEEAMAHELAAAREEIRRLRQQLGLVIGHHKPDCNACARDWIRLGFAAGPEVEE